MTYEVTIHYRDESSDEVFIATSIHEGRPGAFNYWRCDIWHIVPWDLISSLEIREIEDGDSEQAGAGA